MLQKDVVSYEKLVEEFDRPQSSNFKANNDVFIDLNINLNIFQTLCLLQLKKKMKNMNDEFARK